ncbi:MAG: FAD-dependent oxidoreductase [Proteobacteria bacterium]|nr:FAD-dependent oxidoreductase [Pseudomonadota bacterium]
MKRAKDRLHRVMIIGATPAGITAANKLGELGIPVTLVDSESDIDNKLNNEKWRLNSGVPLNYAHRPGLVRIFRNPNIQCILPADIKFIKHSPQGFMVRLERHRTFIDPDKCTLCGQCVEVCPVEIPADNAQEKQSKKKAVHINSRHSLPGMPVIDKRKRPLCQDNCPLGVNVQGYIALTKAGKFNEALELIRRDNVLPAVCGRICTHPCEAACRRGELDGPVAIRDIKRFVADYQTPKYAETVTENAEKKTDKIAVIGSGPAGLAAAAELARMGYPVTVFEKEKMAGGLLRYGIGAHRLPRDILDKEIEYIENLGVNFTTNHLINMDSDIDKMKNDFQSIIITTGAWSDRRLGIPGEEFEGIEGCLSFLVNFYRNEDQKINGKIAVIGDGNAAFDLARTLKRNNPDVTILSWFAKELIPADPDEVKAAIDEGIIIKDSTQTIEFLGQNGTLDKLLCVPTEPGEPNGNNIAWPVRIKDSTPFELKFDKVFVAIGQKGAYKNTGNDLELTAKSNGTLETDYAFRTSLSGVYAAGDTISGPSSVVSAMANGRQAAQAVHQDICKSSVVSESTPPALQRPDDRDFDDIPKSLAFCARSAMPEQQPAERIKSFTEVALGLDESQISYETQRCLQCGICSECLQCQSVCSAIGAINHSQAHEEIIEHTGVVIIADPDIHAQVKGDDVIRAYGPKVAKQDVYDMIVRGYASAAQAMVLLGKSSRTPRGHGISFLTPDQGLSPVIRIGVFACKCNNSMGWLDDMDSHIKSLKSQSDIVHAETINSACIPDGSSHILKTIRDLGITRVVLASCVCCPLNFICSACTDQKSRLKEALFAATGVSRSMVETCNLRGEVLRLVKDHPKAASNKFIGLINRSIDRAKQLKALPALARNYNMSTAVIGDSESALTSAMTLAQTGFDVFLFGSFGHPPVHPNIHIFQGATLKGLSGTIGEFQLTIQTQDFEQTIHAGAVILGEKSRKKIQYIQQKGLAGISIKSGRQKKDILGIPFLYPGATAIPGLFLAETPGINVSKRKKGYAAAIQAAAVMPRGPRQNKGYTIEIDQEICRGCGNCMNVCPYQAIRLNVSDNNGWHATVDEALCKGCGSCISVCPSSAADSPYRNETFLEQALKELLA